MSGHDHEQRSSRYMAVSAVIVVIAVIMLIIALHPFGTDLNLHDNENINISVLMPFTGGQSEFGIAYSRGVALAAQEINEGGGISGAKVNVEYYDYGGDLTQVKIEFFNTFDRKVPVIIGPLTSTEAIEVAPYAEMFEVVLISPSATAAELSEYDKYFFRTVPQDTYLGTGVAKTFGNRPDVSKIMVIYTDGTYGIGLKDKMKEEIESSFHEKTVVSEFMIPESGNVNVDEIIKEMKDTGADGVFIIVGSPGQLVSILNGANEAGLSPLWIGTDNSITSEIALAGEYSDGFMACAPSQMPTDPTFESRFYNKFSTTKGISNAVYGYDTMMIIAQCIHSRGYSGPAIMDGLDDIRYVGLTGAIRFDGNGDRYPSYDVMEYDYAEGEWVTLKWSQLLDFSSVETHHKE